MRSERRTALAIGVAVFLSGAVLLGLEIAASRVLAPTFGSSLYVWGSLIGIVLTGLAVGYWAGGVIADRLPTPYLLVGTLTVGAALVALVPVMDERVLEWIVTWDPGPRLDPLLAAAILFGPASVVLASASPIAVRLAARSLERLGRTAGRLFSVSTAGSIVRDVRDRILARARARHRSGARRRRDNAPGGRAHDRRHRAAARGFRASRRGDRRRACTHPRTLTGTRRSAQRCGGAQLVPAVPDPTRPHPRAARPRRDRLTWQLHRARGAGDPISPPRRRR